MRACTSGGEKSPRPPGGSDTRATSPSREGPLLHYAIHAFRPPRSRGPRALQSRPSSACARHPNSRIEILDRESFAPLPSPSRTSNFQPRTLFFPFLSFPVRLSSGRESKGRESTRGREEFSRVFPLPFLFAPILCSIGSNCQFQFGGKRKMAEWVERRKTDFDGASRTVGWNGTERAEDRRFLSEGNGWNLGATLGENGFLSRWRTVPRCHIRPGAG